MVSHRGMVPEIIQNTFLDFIFHIYTGLSMAKQTNKNLIWEKLIFTCRCWFVGANVWSGLRVQIVCQEIASDCYDVCRAIGWNGRMPENGYLKCLIKDTVKEKSSVWSTQTNRTDFILLSLQSHSPSLSEALAEGMLSSRSGMFSRVALSSLWTTIFSLPFDLSISFLASIKERFSVTVPLICGMWKKECEP